MRRGREQVSRERERKAREGEGGGREKEGWGRRGREFITITAMAVQMSHNMWSLSFHTA